MIENMRKLPSDLDRYQYLMHLMCRNEKLFYKTIIEHITECMPVQRCATHLSMLGVFCCQIVYTPTVGQACQKFGHVFKSPVGEASDSSVASSSAALVQACTSLRATRAASPRS